MRPSKDDYFVAMAQLVSQRGTCARRKVGAVFVNSKGHVIATGYNGVARGFAHCSEGEGSCSGVSRKPGEGLDECGAIHAEQNALLQCKDVYEIQTAYLTTSPCIHCVKLLLNTGCKRIVFVDKYPHVDPEVLWKASGRLWEEYQPKYKIHLQLVTNSLVTE